MNNPQPHTEDMNKGECVLCGRTYGGVCNPHFCGDSIAKVVEEAAELKGYERGLEAAEKAIREYMQKQFHLYNGVLPFAAMGRTTDSEAYAIYNQGVTDSVKAIQSLRENKL